MKKLIAILTILALALSVAPVAFAGTNSYMEISGTVDEENMCALQVDFATPVTTGQTVSFDFRPYLTDDLMYNGLSIRFFQAAAKAFNVIPEEYDDNNNVTAYYIECLDETFAAEDSIVITAGYDGWTNVTFTAASDLEQGFFVRFYYGDAAAYEVGTVLKFDVDNLKVGDKVCSFNETNAVAIGETNTATFKFDDGTEFTAAKAYQMDWTMAIKAEESTNPNASAGDVTPDTGADDKTDANGDKTDDKVDEDPSVSTVWIITGAVVGVVLVAAVVVIVVAKKKK